MLIPKNFRLRRAEFRIPTCDYHVPKLKWNVAKFKWNVITAIFIQFSATQSLSLSGFLFKRYALENCFKRSFLGTLKKVEMVFEVERDATVGVVEGVGRDEDK